MVLGGVHAGINFEPARPNGEIVEAGNEIDPPHLLDFQAPPRRPEVEGQPLQADHPMAEAMQMGVALAVLAREVVDQDNGYVPPGKELLQRQHLAPVAKRVLRQQTHFRQAVEDDAGGFDLFDLLLDQA